MGHCENTECRRALPIDATVRRRFCSGRCRAKAHRQRTAEKQEVAMRLLLEQTRAIAAGADPAVLDEIQREAERLFGDAA